MKNRNKTKTKNIEGVCNICRRPTCNGFELESRYGTSVTLICPDCLVNSDEPEVKEARRILGVRI